MGRWKKIMLALALGLTLAGGVSAAEPFYLNGDTNFPMVQNTGGIYEEGGTGLFIDLSTVKVENVFDDGLACQVDTLNVVKGKETGSSVLHVRFSVDGKAWAKGLDGKWREIPENQEDPASLAVRYIRGALGDDAQRDRLMNQIDTIAAAKKDNLGKVAPADAVPLQAADSPVPRKQAVKTKGQVRKETPAPKETKEEPKEDVVVTITEAPKVEITSNPPVQVEIT